MEGWVGDCSYGEQLVSPTELNKMEWWVGLLLLWVSVPKILVQTVIKAEALGAALC
jgi:hypothetical protein